jgi:hypothetical protein
VFVFLTPMFALLFGALWLREAVTPSLLAALALVAVGHRAGEPQAGLSGRRAEAWGPFAVV